MTPLGNRTRYFPACSAMPQTTAPPQCLFKHGNKFTFKSANLKEDEVMTYVKNSLELAKGRKPK
jgi:hypothetical protein